MSRNVHLWLAISWALLAIPTIIFWRNSILWVSFMSIYAIVISHLAAWAAKKAEVASND